MKKIWLIENIVLALTINLSCLFTTYYQHRIDGSYSVADIIFDFLFTAMLTWFFVIFFTKNESVFSPESYRLHGKRFKILIKFLVLILIKWIFDIAILFLGQISVEYKYLGSGLISAAFWLIGYTLCVQKDIAIWKSKKRLLVFSGLILLVLAVGMYYDIHLINQTHLLTVKYRINSPYMIRACRNIDFCSSIKNFIVDTVILVSLVIFHTTQVPLFPQRSRKKYNIIQLYARCNIILIFFLILCMLKFAIDPQGVLYWETYEPFNKKFYESEGPFDLTSKNEMVLSGIDKTSFGNNPYYFIEIASLQKNCEPEEFKGNGKNPTLVFTDKGNHSTDYIKFSIEERNVYLYGHYAICYYENGVTPRIIRINSLNQYENNTIIIELSEHLIEEGNLFMFEYAVEYLKNYDPEFIQPYIERYEKGLFNTNELRWMEETYYRSDYIINLAKRFS